MEKEALSQLPLSDLKVVSSRKQGSPRKSLQESFRAMKKTEKNTHTCTNKYYHRRSYLMFVLRKKHTCFLKKPAGSSHRSLCLPDSFPLLHWVHKP